MDKTQAENKPQSAARTAGSQTWAATTALFDAIATDLGAAARHLRRRAPAAREQLRRSGARLGGWGTQAGYWGRRGASATRTALRPLGVVRTFLLLALAAIAAIAGLLAWALYDLPYASVLEEGEQPAILLEAADGALLARKGPVKEADVTRAELPDHLIDAVLSIEDRRFYTHRGIDPRGILRAMRRNIDAGGVVQGGSTITQQLVKIRYLDQEQTLKRKIREAALAIWLDAQLGKDEILTRYLNNVYFGAGATGIAAAARIYFDKEVSELTLAESALLAGLIKAPSQYNPLRSPEVALQRTSVVLDAMVANRKIDAETAEAVKAEPAELHPARIAAHSGTWFADWVHSEAAEIAGSQRGALRVRTTLVPPLQEIAERVVREALEGDAAAVGAGQAALVAMRPDGAVLAMVGGRNYEESEFNRATRAMRQPGSAFKLFVYYAALRNGIAIDDRIEDAPIEIDGWEPENFSEQFVGEVTLAEAFAHSLNAATVRLAQEVGIAEVIAAARELGIEAPLSETPSLALGTSEVTLLDMTEAYAAVRAGIAPIEAWGIAGFGGHDQSRLFGMGPPLEERRPLGEHHEPLVRLLRGVVESGTGRRAALDGFAAGKTGTSQNYRDAWFIGFSEPLVVGVWVGNDDGTSMDEVTGGRLPAEIWRRFMTEALELARSAPIATAAPPADAAGAERQQPSQRDQGEGTAGEAENETQELATAEAEQEPAAEGTRPTIAVLGGSAERREVSLFEEARAMSEAAEPEQPQCNVRVCARFYRSFRASDCTFQPYGGGPRRLCER
jgi:penicillin-binding protein 1A